MHSHEAVRGTAGDDDLVVMRGGVFAFGGNDTITATAQDDLTQIHTYAAAGNDLTFLNFAAIAGFAHGHHVRGGSGEDSFDFTNIDNVSGFVVGRIEDFDIRSDEIRIEGQALDFSNLPENVRVVAFNGQHDDPGSLPQPWLHIETAAGGDIFYALEGARVDMDQVASQEPHFLTAPVDLSSLQEIDYVSPNNYLPDNHDPVSGLVIEDVDATRADVVENIFGSDLDDLIAASLNDDTVHAGAGDDNIFAGSGNDAVFGGAGHDQIEGSTGHDYIDGGTGRDDLTGGEGEDLFVFADFDRGFDVIRDFVPGTDQIVIDHQGMDAMDDLRFVRFNYEETSSALIRFVGEDGVVDKSMGGVVLKGIMPDELSERDFIFDDVQPPEMPGEPVVEDPVIVLPDPIIGTGSAEQFEGTNGTDLIFGMGGSDTVDAGAGNDVVDGGKGRDDLTGGEGEDLFVFADFDRGFDVIRDFVQGTDQIIIDHEGMDGVEDLRFVKFNYEDTPSALVRFRDETGTVDKTMGGIVLKGVLHTDLLESDFIFGDVQPFEASPEAAQAVAPDPIVGTRGADTLEGTDAADDLSGLAGRDTIDAGAGDDLIDGGRGRDDLTGGEGEDLFVFADFDRGFDVIRDFVQGTDQIIIDHQGMDSSDDLRFVKFNYEDTPSALIRFRDETGAVDKSMGGIVLKGVLHTDLSESDFFFGDPQSMDPITDSAAEATPEASEAIDIATSDLIDALFIRHDQGHATLESMAEHTHHDHDEDHTLLA